MARISTQTAWSRIVGVTVLVGLTGCSLRDAPVPPPAPQAHEEVTPAPVPQGKETAPPEKPTMTQTGMASWYGPGFHGKETASGDPFDQHALTAAHRTLPLGTEAKVTNVDTGQSVNVEITDRGPAAKNRQIDLSKAAAKQIGLTKKGVAKVKIEAKPPPAGR